MPLTSQERRYSSDAADQPVQANIVTVHGAP